MTDEGRPQAEVESLRAEVERYRQQELDTLRATIEELRQERDHYRSEAHRNAEIGRKIDEEARRDRESLLGDINALRNASLTPTGVSDERATQGLGRAPGG